MRVLIVPASVPFTPGRAEVLAENLQRAFFEAGHEAEVAAIPFNPHPPSRIIDQMLACRLLDVTESCGTAIDRVIGLNFPGYLVSHPNKVLWLLHQHRPAYDLWDHPPDGGLINFPEGPRVREAIQRADRELIPECKVVYTLSNKASERLWCSSGIPSKPLYNPPPGAGRLFSAASQNYFFCPSPAGGIQRRMVVVEALAKTSDAVRVVFAGAADDPEAEAACVKAARDLKAGERIEWLGKISEERRAELYARCVGVIFPPADEDCVDVALEAMLSSKPVLTCSDSGAPLDFVVSGKTGLVVDPTVESMADAMDLMWSDRGRAKAWGEAGRDRYSTLGISWRNVVGRLLS